MGDKRVELSYASAVSDTPLLGDTIGANFDRTVTAFPDRLALVDVPAGLRYTYAELKDEVDALAYALLEAGIAKGDRVGIWSPNRAEWTVTQYATAKLGVILVNINPAYRTSELEFVLNQSGCRMLIAAQRLKTSDYAAMIAEVRPRPVTTRCGWLSTASIVNFDCVTGWSGRNTQNSRSARSTSWRQ